MKDPRIVKTPSVKLGKRIRSLRLKRRLTQNDLAWKAGLADHSTVGHYERGRSLPSLYVSWRLAEALGVDLVKLVGQAFDAHRSDGRRPKAVVVQHPPEKPEPKPGLKHVGFEGSPKTMDQESWQEPVESSASMKESAEQDQDFLNALEK